MTEEIKVNDRRGASTEEKDDAQNKTQGQSTPNLDITFSNFVISLATQAMMQIGAIQPPPGMDISVNKDAAKQTISILEILKVKTEGNLDEEEKLLLEDILHNLRLSFLRLS